MNSSALPMILAISKSGMKFVINLAIWRTILLFREKFDSVAQINNECYTYAKWASFNGLLENYLSK